MSIFGQKLKALRTGAGLTQEQLAEKAGLHKLGIAKLEQGLRAPTWDTVQALAKALGASCEDFQVAPLNPEPSGRGRPAKDKAEPVQSPRKAKKK